MNLFWPWVWSMLWFGRCMVCECKEVVVCGVVEGDLAPGERLCVVWWVCGVVLRVVDDFVGIW